MVLPQFINFEQFARVLTQSISLVIDLIALFVIAASTVRAMAIYVTRALRHTSYGIIEEIRLDLGHALVLGLEFLIGADILRTAVAPTWTSIGQLGAIILLRTLLDYFLERELRDISPDGKGKGEKNRNAE